MTGKYCPPGSKKDKTGKVITVPMLGKKKGKKK